MSCQTPGPDIAAVISEPDQASRQALHQALTQALGGIDVLLSETALTQSSLLTLQPGESGSQVGKIAQGRVVEKPLQFRLVRSDTQCWLVDLRNERRYRLENTTCVNE